MLFSAAGLTETQWVWNNSSQSLHSIMAAPSTLGIRHMQWMGMDCQCAAFTVIFLHVFLIGNVVNRPSSMRLLRWGRITISSNSSFAGDAPRQSAVAYGIHTTVVTICLHGHFALIAGGGGQLSPTIIGPPGPLSSPAQFFGAPKAPLYCFQA